MYNNVHVNKTDLNKSMSMLFRKILALILLVDFQYKSQKCFLILHWFIQFHRHSLCLSYLIRNQLNNLL